MISTAMSPELWTRDAVGAGQRRRCPPHVRPPWEEVSSFYPEDQKVRADVSLGEWGWGQPRGTGEPCLQLVEAGHMGPRKAWGL